MVMEVAAAAAAREDSLRANSGLKDFVFIYKTVDIAKLKTVAALNKMGLATETIDRIGTDPWLQRYYTDEKGHKKNEPVDWLNFSHNDAECYVIINVFNSYGHIQPQAFSFTRVMAGLYGKDFTE